MDPTVAIEPLQMPDKAAARYMSQFHIAALAVFCPLRGVPCQPVAADNLADAVTRARKLWPRELDAPILARAWWLSGIRPAQQVLNLALACDLRDAALTRGRLAVPLDAVAAALTAAAARLQMQLTDYAVGLSRVRAATGQLTDRLAEAQASGALKGFNQEYARRRRAAQAAGLKFMAYRQARSRLQAVLGHAAHRGVITADVLAEVLDAID